jgi:hypothetical protein
MSTATLEREGGDDRDPEVEIQKLQEMYDRPDAREILYVSNLREVGIGDIALRATGDKMARLRGHAVIRHATPTVSRGPNRTLA